MTPNETLLMIAYMLAPAFFSLLGLAGLGSPAIAVFGEIGAKTKKRVFYDKYGQQAASMGLILNILLLLLYGGLAAVAFTKYPQLIKPFLSTTNPILPAIIGLALFFLCGIPYALTWKKMRQAKGLHIPMGTVAALGAAVFMGLIVPFKMLYNPETGGFRDIGTYAPMLTPLAVAFVFFMIAVAAAFSAAYLVMRRNKDDFGRDYYNFSLKLAARWATIPMVAFMACQGWLFAVLPAEVKTLVTGTPLLYVWIGIIAAGLCAMGTWIALARSERPLQFKGLTLLGLLFLWIMHALNATLLLNFLTMQ